MKVNCARTPRAFLFTALFITGVWYGSLRAQADVPVADTTAAKADTMSPSVPRSGQMNVDIGYNLKVMLRLIPVYAGKSLTDSIMGYLPQNSVVAVVQEEENWYEINYGAGTDRKSGWVISYGVERTHELEHIITTIESASRWQGQKIEVVAGESTILAFPSSGAQLLNRVYRGEIFDIDSEAEQYYRVKLPSGVAGWIWKGDVEIYKKPKYSPEEIQALHDNAVKQDQRTAELLSLSRDLSEQGRKIDDEIEVLERVLQHRQARAQAAVRRREQPSIWNYDSLRHRVSLSLGMRMQGFSPSYGLSSGSLRGIGLRIKINEKVTYILDRSSGKPAVLALGKKAGQTAVLPSAMRGLDTLNVGAKMILNAVSYRVDASRWPMLKHFDNSLVAGLGYMRLQATAAQRTRRQNLWGPVLGWNLSKHLFSHIDFELGLSWFFTSAEVTGVLDSGPPLLARKSKLSRNRAINLGVTWGF